MPATEQTWRDLKLMHAVFGVSALAMLIATVWMLASDHAREWKHYQREFRDKETWVADARVAEQATQEYAAEHDTLVAKWMEARAQVPDAAQIEEFKRLVRADAEKRVAPAYDFTEFDKIYASLPALVKTAKDARQASDRATQEAKAAWDAASAADQKALEAQSEATAEAPALVAAADAAKKRAGEAHKVAMEADKQALEAEQKAGDARDRLLGIMRDIVASTKSNEDELAQRTKFKQADLNEALSNFDLGVSQGAPDDRLEQLQGRVNEIRKGLDALSTQTQSTKVARIDLERILKQVTDAEDKTKKTLDDQTAQLNRLETALDERAPNPGKRFLELPIIDAFGRPLKIDQIWLPKLTINNNFRDVARFDRCTTCHQGIDKTLPGAATEGAYPVRRRELVPITLPAMDPPAPQLDAQGNEIPLTTKYAYGLELANEGLVKRDDVTVRVVWPKGLAAQVGLIAGDTIEMVGGIKVITKLDAENRLLAGRDWKQPLDLQIRRGLPHPFSSHPRLDLFVGSLSPHPLQVVGCTICHDGQGSGTTFQYASHSPNDPEEAASWSRDYNWKFNHNWIYPMDPRRFAESTCLKCHHQVTELEPSERFPVPPAPKLVHGYDLVRRYGCFGCHEINGFDGPNKRIGPDLRLEPAYAAAAQQLTADPGFPKLDSDDRARIELLIQHPDNDAARRLIREMLLADKSVADKLAADPSGPKPRLDATSDKLESVLKDVDTPGQMRKVGPSLRHVAAKNDFNWIYSWINNPTDFRPTTRMPRFFGLRDHLQPVPKRDEHGQEELDSSGHPVMETSPGLAEAQKFEPIEVRAVTEFLLASSQPFQYVTQSPGVTEEPVAVKAARGKLVFERRGCLACHQHSDFPAATAVHGDRPMQGPDLSRIGAKLSGNRNGPLWLYSWVRDPQHYSPRTVMPNLFLEPVVGKDGKTTDPAEDLTLYLLTSQQDWKPQGVPSREMNADEKQALTELATQYLAEKFTVLAPKYIASGIPESRSAGVKGDEAVLVVSGNVSPQEMEQRVLQYVGRRTVSKYGCSGCHDIPGFEDSKPIGTALADWGRKDPGKLAFEQIVQYLGAHGHGEPTSAAPDPDHEYYTEKLMDHQREGFIWQKLLAPRSYDFKKTENKRYNERLRMPQFPFNDADREAVITFVLGLVAEPPAPQYIYKPTPRRDAITKGRRALEKFNCGGCHILEMARWDLAFPPDTFGKQTANPDYPFLSPHFTPEEIDTSKKIDRRGMRHATLIGMPLLRDSDGHPIRYDEEGTPLPDDDTTTAASYKFTLWKDTLIDGEPWVVKATDPLVAKIRVASGAGSVPDTGDLARFLWPVLATEGKQANPPMSDGQNAWGFVPPPLLNEGRKVQSRWLHDFLLDPYRIRPTVVLRMPRFNMTSEEATNLVDYFAAIDGVEYPYQYDPRNNESYLTEEQQDYHKLLVERHDDPNRDRLDDALKIVTSNDYCVKCHQVGDFIPVSDPNSMAPNLAGVSRRLRPEFVKRWIADPAKILPYTVMPVNIKPTEPLDQKLFVGTNVQQIDGLVDLLMNFSQHMLKSVRPLIKPPATAPGTPGTPAGAEE